MRTRLLLVLAVVAAAIIAVPAVRWWLDGPDLEGTGDPDLAPACPADPEQPASEADGDSVPVGATSVLLCNGPGNGFQVPEDALTTRVDELARVVNAQDRADYNGCPDDLGIGYRLVFGYPDGTAFDVTGQLYGCRVLQVGKHEHTNPSKPWDLFIEALREQRSAATPPGSDERPECLDRNGLVHSPIGDPGEMTDAVLCARFWRKPERNGSAAFSATDLAVLLADRRDRPSLGDDGLTDERCTADRREYDIVGITPWGDHVSMDGICGVVYDGDSYWEPGPEAREVITRLYDEADLG